MQLQVANFIFCYQRSSSNSMEIPSAVEQTCWISQVFSFINLERSLSFESSGKPKTNLPHKISRFSFNEECYFFFEHKYIFKTVR